MAAMFHFLTVCIELDIVDQGCNDSALRATYLGRFYFMADHHASLEKHFAPFQ